MSQNPVLKGIADYLVDEGNYEEQALLGQFLLLIVLYWEDLSYVFV
jgi:hypothetical protein